MSKKKLKAVIKRLSQRLQYEEAMCDTLKKDSAFLGYSCKKIKKKNKQMKQDINFLKGLNND